MKAGPSHFDLFTEFIYSNRTGILSFSDLTMCSKIIARILIVVVQEDWKASQEGVIYTVYLNWDDGNID